MSTASPPSAVPAIEPLARLLEPRGRVVALTGAGLSTESGIPDYRDDAGAWKRKPPVVLAEFLRSESARKRYWARSLVGWPSFSRAQPNAGHAAFARLEAAGRVHHLITQNVDRLHQRAGSVRVTDLHGRLDEVECRACAHRETRDAMQARLAERNPGLSARAAARAPDGDADLEAFDFDGFEVPPCPDCGGILKPSVVFFGEAVPAPRVSEAYARVAEADALLVAGTSLEVFSGRRFIHAAVDRGIPIAVVNRGATRADAVATVKVAASCGPALADLARRLLGPASA